ncbi:MAG: nucleoside-diphosphate sugar epimerase/dehydratase [Synechococcaceae cyanobacterium]|nr:nucleoside-diphosphate sugar epimerase/dehydratase [Synechococcaceae cyanobacterium]
MSSRTLQALVGGSSRALLTRRVLLLLLDAVLLAACFWATFALRLQNINSLEFRQQLHLLPWALGPGLLVLLASGWYRSLIRYSSSHSLYGMLPRTALLVLLLLLVSTLLGGPRAPRSFWILFWLLFSGAAIASRVLLRDLLRLQLQAGVAGGAVPTLIYGAGEAGSRLIESLRFEPAFRLVAVVDDDPSLRGLRLQRLPIRAPSELPALVERHGISQVLLAMPSLPRGRRRVLVQQLTGLGLRVMVMPSLAQIASGERRVSDLRPLAIEDLLGREPSPPDPQLLRAAVAGRAVLVTGAGGSIGAELCRQIVRLQPTRLVLLERNEYALYAIEQDLRALLPREGGPELRPLLADVSDRAHLVTLLRRHGIQVLFHAAAYKHVPLVEANLCAGLANNILGTRSVLEAAIACGLERFTLISTDKAVRPTNAMGASKRACELLVQDAAARLRQEGRGPICSMVRFGNVLGSSGSVVPRFRSQIAAGGPVTVTHPEITRYFMTIPEAVQLVLQASGMASGGEVFVLDMGEPVRIADLARQMVELSGLSVRDEANPDGDLAIEYTGLRPGEKLYEELLISADDLPTAHPLILRAIERSLPPQRLRRLIADLEEALARWDDRQALRVLRQLVEEYRPPGAGPVADGEV